MSKRIPKGTYGYINGVLFDFELKKRELEQKRNDILEAFPDLYSEHVRGTDISDPTGNRAVKLDTVELVHLAHEIEAVEATIAVLNQDQLFIYNRFFKDKIGKWQVVEEMHVSPETFQRRKKEVIEICGRFLGVYLGT
jgi:hypothetical protein